MICRDRAGSFADGARTGAPDAVQVADRFHLWQNLAKAAGKCVAAHRSYLAEPTPPPALDEQEPALPDLNAPHRPTPPGRSPATWAGACTPSSASTWQELADGRWKGPRPSKPGPFKPYLDQHADGARGSIRRLFGEITALGYAGSYPVVRDYLTRNRPAREPLPPAPPTVRDVTNWLCRHPDTLTEDEKPRLTAILDRCPELQAASDQVRSFAAMITDLTGQDLPQGRAAARDAALPGIASFAKGLEQDLDAVTSGLTTRWNSGPVEGRVNLRGRFAG